MEIWVASGNAHGETKGVLVSMWVPLSQNCYPYYLPTIANKFYFDQVTSAFLEGLALAVRIKILISLQHFPLPQSVFWLCACLDVNECCCLSLSGQPLDGTYLSPSSRADVIPINYSENCIILGPSWGDSLSSASPFELRLFRYPLRATLYVLAGCWYKQPKNVNGSGEVAVILLYAFNFMVDVANY